MRGLTAAVGFLGALIFGSAFILSLVNPAFVESVGKDLIRAEVEKRVKQRIESLDSDKLVAIAERMTARNAEQIAAARRYLSDGLPQKVAGVIAEMRDLSCECRKAVERTVTEHFEWRIADLSRVNERLTVLIRSQYMNVAESLTREFRIFTGANTLVFLILGVVSLIRPGTRIQLVAPAIVLVCAAIGVAYAYLFGQNWLHTIIFNQYVGFAYFAYLGVTFLFLADIVFNRARITTRLLNLAAEAVGSALRVVPC